MVFTSHVWTPKTCQMSKNQKKRPIALMGIVGEKWIKNKHNCFGMRTDTLRKHE